MSAGNVARIVAVVAACIAAVGSATSRSSSDGDGRARQSQYASAGGNAGAPSSPPPPQQMDASRALGLWRSTFGAVKIEPDNRGGGLEAGSLQGIWVYQRQGQEVVGYFAGNLRGNVLEFRWNEPNDPPLTGAGFLVFDVQGRQYSGRWWSDKRDRVGDWNGWRQGPQGTRPRSVDANSPYKPRSVDTASPYGGQGYGDPDPFAPPPTDFNQANPYQPQGQGQTYQPSPYQRRQPYQPSQAQPPQQAPAPQRQPADPRYY